MQVVRQKSIRVSIGCALVLTTVAVLSPVRAQQALTLDWIFGGPGEHVADVPKFAWRPDSTLLLYDDRQPSALRAFEILDPSTGLRRPFGDASKALATLNELLPASDRVSVLAWPSALDEGAAQGLYTFGGDLYLLTLATAAWTRVTNTTPAETAARFSPDGNKIAFIRDHDLYVYEIAARSEKQLTDDGSETILNGTLSWVYWEEVFGRRDIGYWWSPDSQAIAFLRTDEADVALSHFVDVVPVPPRLLTQRYPVAGTPNPKVRVGVVELPNPSPSWVQIAESSYEYIARVQWLPDSRRLAIHTMPRDQTRLDVWLVNRGGAGATRLLTETDPGWINITDDLYFLKDGHHVIWASERDGYQHLYRYTIDGALVNRITKGDWAIASNAGGVFWARQAVAAIDELKDWIYFVALEKSSIERQLYRIHNDGSGFSRLSKEKGTHLIRFSPNGLYYVDRFSDVRSLPSLTLHAADGALVQTIAAPRNELLAPYAMQFPELLTIPAQDGFPMPAQILKPAEFRSDYRYPVILYVYGGPSAPTVRDAWQFYNLYNQLLLREGYLVVQVDNRAATGISKRLENTILKRSGEPETADLLDAVRWLKAQPYVDPARVGVWGWSGGGTMTLNLMTRSGEFKAGIAVAPVTDWKYYDTKWTESLMKRPAENPEGYAASSLVVRAKNLHGRLLLMHGTYDDNVHPQNSQAFINELIANGIVFEAMIYPMRKHDIGDDAAQGHLFKTMIDFWKRAL